MDVGVLRSAIERYNRYGSLKAAARLVEAGEKRFLVSSQEVSARAAEFMIGLKTSSYEMKELDPTLDIEIVSWKWISSDAVLAEFMLGRKAKTVKRHGASSHRG